MGHKSLSKGALAFCLSLIFAGAAVADVYEDPGSLKREEIKAHEAVMATPHQYKHPTLSSNSDEGVDIALILMIDVSGSIDGADYDAQIKSLAQAIGSDNFRDAIFLQGGVSSIAISVIDYGTSISLRIPWIDIREGDENKLDQLAHEIFNLQRRESGSTNQADAIDFAGFAFDNLPWEADRKNAQIITDGEHNHSSSSPLTLGIKKMNELGATLDAFLIIDGNNPNDLKEYAEEKLRTTQTIETEDGHIVDEGFVVIVATNNSPSNPGALVRYYQDMLRALVIRLRPETASLDSEKIQETPFLGKPHKYG